MNWLLRVLRRKAHTVTVSKSQKDLLEFFLSNRTDFDQWLLLQPAHKIRFQFFYPTAIDFYYADFKLFTAYFSKNRGGDIELAEFKMTETNHDSIRCASWAPFEELIISFVSSLEESKRLDLFEKRKTLYEYEALCTKKQGSEKAQEDYLVTVTSAPFLSR